MIYNFEKLTFQVLSIGVYRHQKGVYKVKGRPYASFTFRTKGVGAFKIAGKEFLSRAGDVMFFPEGEEYEVDYSDGESIVLHLTECNYFEVENFTPKASEIVRAKFEKIVATWNSRRPVNGTKAAVYDLLQHLANEQTEKHGDDAFLSCVEYLEEHFCEPTMSAEVLCKRFFISEATLRRKFGISFGCSFKQYLLNLRFDRAMSLLNEGQLSIKEIAFLSGFSDEKYFSRAIKEKFGHPPSAFLGRA